MPDEYAVLLSNFLRDSGLGWEAINKVVLASVVPALTDAIRVTTVPEPTVVTTLAFDFTVRVVLVAALVCAEAIFDDPHTIAANIRARTNECRFMLTFLSRVSAR